MGCVGSGGEPGPGMAGAGNDGSAGNAISACVAGSAGRAGRDGRVVEAVADSGRLFCGSARPLLRQAQGRLLSERGAGPRDGLAQVRDGAPGRWRSRVWTLLSEQLVWLPKTTPGGWADHGVACYSSALCALVAVTLPHPPVEGGFCMSAADLADSRNGVAGLRSTADAVRLGATQ